MLLVALSAALAAPPGFHVTREDVVGCDLMLGPAGSDGIVPMRAECHWPDVTVDQFVRAYGDWARHDEIFSSVSESTIVSTSGNTTVTRQVFVASGIKDREELTEGTKSDIPGGVKFAWRKKPGDQGITSGNVEMARNEGFWEVTAHPEGGVLAVHQATIDPGGSVPGFLVRWFQTSGLTAVVTEMKAAIR
jgi:hypothetical protein